ncbi:MAG: TetR/AcrR family transcriptional regulator [Bryobacter sp.]|nr:TetR/AcrR family transcriptional regulator [Bryobacter sp.]
MNDTNVRENSPDTKERILDATERLIATRGIEATSLRQITAEAQVNLAAVNYHFQTKDDLIVAVYLRRIRPMNAERLALLDELEATYNNGKIPFPELLNAFYEPVVNMAQRLEAKGTPIGVMLGRLYTEPVDHLNKLWMEEMATVVGRFAMAFQRAAPTLSREEVFWRMWFSVGVIAHTMGAGPKLAMASRGLVNVGDREEVLRRMIQFATAAWEAPAL